MEKIRFAEYNLSRLMLGTVQFGLPYGVANRAGQPDYDEVLAIVATAVDGGVNAFDTGASYGSSEEVLGRVLHELGVADRVVVITKIRALTPGESADAAAAARAIEESVANSRRRLRLDCLPVVLFHREADAVHLDVLERLKARGWLRQAGVSCDNVPGPAARFAGEPAVSALQIPANILDRRHLRAGSFTAAAARGVAVFVRSVYLQGLLLMPENEIPPALQAVVPARRALTAVAASAGMTLAELAVRYMLGQTGVTSVITGVETVAQVRENIALFSRSPLTTDLLAAVDAVVPDLPDALLTPFLWPTLSIKGEQKNDP
jgi:aryl-alcohol dehydrogenase-like predicted oxidoreductase